MKMRKLAVIAFACFMLSACSDDDDDRDGVKNSVDQCPNTPKGAKVDAKGCELDDDDDGVGNSVDDCPNTPKGVKVNARGCPVSPPPPSVTEACPGLKVTVATEKKFTDTFVTKETADTPWAGPKTYETVTVADIQAAFNKGRAADSTISGKLAMPSQAKWDKMSNSEKGLYLVNSERCARGIRPFEAVELNLVQQPTQYYADFLATIVPAKGPVKLSHEADGTKVEERLKNAGVIVGTNADSFEYGENLAYFSGSLVGKYPKISAPIARSVYHWIYADKVNYAGPYSHRLFTLATGLIENSGKEGKEGLVSFATATHKRENPDHPGYSQTIEFVVMNAFDPKGNWSKGHTKKVEIKAPIK